MPGSPEAELLFVVDVSSFTDTGFVSSTTYGGKDFELEFDDADQGVYLSPEMAKRLGVRKGSKVKIFLEDGAMHLAEATVAGTGSRTRVSVSKVYYAVGKEGGAIVRMRRA